MITIRSVTKAFGPAVALSDVSLTAEEGKTTVLLGARGAGKTALMDIVCGVSAPDEGGVLIDGYDIVTDPMEAKRHIGYMPESPAAYRDMTPRGQLKFIGQARELSARSLNERVEKVLAQTKLGEVANQSIQKLPPVYLQRMGLAQAVMGEMKSIALDCPTRGLDAKQIFELRDIIAEIRSGAALLIATDSLTEALALGDVVYVLDGGRVLGKCAPKDLAEMELDSDATVIVCEGGEEAVRAAAAKAGSPCEKCDMDAGYARATLHTGKGAQAKKAVFRAFAEANLPIVDMRPEKLTIKDIALKLTNEPFAARSGEEGAQAR